MEFIAAAASTVGAATVINIDAASVVALGTATIVNIEDKLYLTGKASIQPPLMSFSGPCLLMINR